MFHLALVAVFVKVLLPGHLKMPLLVPDYTWTQTDSTVYITLSLKGVKLGKVDILSTEEYVKVKLATKRLSETLEYITKKEER